MIESTNKDLLWALYYESDAFSIGGDRIMGRQAAGHSMLKAYANDPCKHIGVYTKSKKFFDGFIDEFKPLLPQDAPNDIDITYIPFSNAQNLKQFGGIFLPSPDLQNLSDQRYFFGSNNHSIVGITHTTASQGVIDSLLNCYTSSLMPWDSLICTSRSVKNSINNIYEQYSDILKLRLGATKRPSFELPIIPLGVHLDDYELDDEEKYINRDSLGIKENDIVILFLGRLSFHAKAHHIPMYIALEEVSKSLPKDVDLHLVQTGWFANEAIESMFMNDSKIISPSIKCHFLDGRDQKIKKLSYSVADIFVSLVDNFQETFGLTPLEGMASGLPVVVSDWDGYRDTVRDSIDGFRIRTTTMRPGSGYNYALRHNLSLDNYDHYIGRTSQTVSIDINECIEKVLLLAKNKELRLKLGANARQRAKEFDWTIILKKYRELKVELDKKREFSITDNQTFLPPARIQDPYTFFSDYPTYTINDNTVISYNNIIKEISINELYELNSITFLDGVAPDPNSVEKIYIFIKETNIISFKSLMLHFKIDYLLLSKIILWLSKYGYLSLKNEK